MKASMPEIIGNIALRKRLCRDILSGSLSHAYILEGAHGSGRHTIALFAASALACEKKQDGSAPLPCLSCPACRKIVEKKSPDVIFIGTDGKASLGVDTARFLREDVRVLPNDLEDKVYIIEDADKMTVQAQNALLLTLEEPPSFAHFFLLCSNAVALLETIRSRAPVLRTEPVSDAELDEYICNCDKRAAQMKLSAPKEYAELIRCASGGIGRALALLEPKTWKPIAEQRAFIRELTSAAALQKGAKTVLPLISKFSNKRDLLNEQLSLLSNALRDLILLKKSDDAPLIFYCDRNEAIELCDSSSLSFLYAFCEAVSKAIDENKRNANVRLLLLKMATACNLI